MWDPRRTPRRGTTPGEYLSRTRRRGPWEPRIGPPDRPPPESLFSYGKISPDRWVKRPSRARPPQNSGVRKEFPPITVTPQGPTPSVQTLRNHRESGKIPEERLPAGKTSREKRGEQKPTLEKQFSPKGGSWGKGTPNSFGGANKSGEAQMGRNR